MCRKINDRNPYLRSQVVCNKVIFHFSPLKMCRDSPTGFYYIFTLFNSLTFSHFKNVSIFASK